MLAKSVNDNAGILNQRRDLRFFASKLAPTACVLYIKQISPFVTFSRYLKSINFSQLPRAVCNFVPYKKQRFIYETSSFSIFSPNHLIFNTNHSINVGNNSLALFMH
ncbi:hypothetical protein SAMN05216202_4721 [Pseudomonas mucidolens]|uniref:Uncharacterized protein n=1 Tax=Pseudomonas mucidolens TaxID=46679 RepID=A0A1H2NUH9_9PSED|nr:hypothetical protein SAMN05216202_4721 [Pseudomonas mucidolens]SQH37481.1 Uncharacterised protein [Pseudomonas mucidolens]